MQARIEAVVNSLNIPSSQAQLLTSKLEDNANLAAFLNGKDYDASGLISLACQSAQLCLGSDSVDTIPLNQTTVDANWSVVLSAQNHRKLTIMAKVPSMLVFSIMRRIPSIGTGCI